MFFSRALLDEGSPRDPSEIYHQLSLPRLDYAQALHDWCLDVSPQTRSPKIPPKRQPERSLRERILLSLIDDPLSTEDIHKKIRGQSVTHNEIVTCLYQLAKEGAVLHHHPESRSHICLLYTS